MRHQVNLSDGEALRQSYLCQNPRPTYEAKIVRGYGARSFLDHSAVPADVLDTMGRELKPQDLQHVALIGGGAAPEWAGLVHQLLSRYPALPKNATCTVLDKHAHGWSPLAEVTREIVALNGVVPNLQYVDLDLHDLDALRSQLETIRPSLVVQQFVANELPQDLWRREFALLQALVANGTIGSVLLIEPSEYSGTSGVFFGEPIDDGVQVAGRLLNHYWRARYGAAPTPALQHCGTLPFFRKGYQINALYLQKK